MATVVNLPQDPSFFGSGLSNAISAYAVKEIQRQEEQDRINSLLDMAKRMKEAGNREDALNIMTDPSIVRKFKRHEDVGAARKLLDEMYPVRDTTPALTKAYHGQTGEEKDLYLTPDQRRQLADPERSKTILGEGFSTTKPELVDFFRTTPDPKGGPASVTQTGKKALGARGEGEFTAAELDRMQKARAEENAAQAADRAASAGERSAAAGERATNHQAFSEDMRWYNAFAGHIADILNVKKTVGQDGQFSFSFEGEPEKAKIFNKATAAGSGLRQKYGSRYLDAGKAALEKVGFSQDPPKDDKPAPKVEAKGGISALKDKVIKAVSGDKKDDATDAVPEPAKRVKGKVYKTPKGKFKWTGDGWEAAN